MIKLKKLHDEAVLPVRATDGSAGFDLTYFGENFLLEPGDIRLIGLGFATQFEPEFVGLVRGRSGNRSKGLVVFDGTVDSDYRGEWKIIISSDRKISIYDGMKIAQVVFTYISLEKFETVLELDDSERGKGGFGSTS